MIKFDTNKLNSVEKLFEYFIEYIFYRRTMLFLNKNTQTNIDKLHSRTGTQNEPEKLFAAANRIYIYNTT